MNFWSDEDLSGTADHPVQPRARSAGIEVGVGGRGQAECHGIHRQDAEHGHAAHCVECRDAFGGPRRQRTRRHGSRVRSAGLRADSKPQLKVMTVRLDSPAFIQP